MRITAQLIEADSGFHLWSQTFDRELDDIFAVQDEIAKAIGAALKVTVGAAQGAGHAITGTTDVGAYDLYLRGISNWHGRQADAMWQAIGLFEQATARDPAFAKAWAGQALVYTVLPAYSNRLSWQEGLLRSRNAALHALALDPASPEAYAALGNTLISERVRETSEALLRRAIALRPSFAAASHWLGNALTANGRLEEALDAMERATELDPRSPVIGDNHAFVLLALGRLDDAHARCRDVLAFAPTLPACLQYSGVIDLLQGRYEDARTTLRALWQTHRSNLGARATARVDSIVDAFAGRGDRDAVAAWLASLAFNSAVDPESENVLEDHMVMLLLMTLGDKADALDFFERTGRDVGSTMDWAATLPQLDPIRCDPRFRATIENLRTTDARAARVCGGDSISVGEMGSESFSAPGEPGQMKSDRPENDSDPISTNMTAYFDVIACSAKLPGLSVQRSAEIWRY